MAIETPAAMRPYRSRRAGLVAQESNQLWHGPQALTIHWKGHYTGYGIRKIGPAAVSQSVAPNTPHKRKLLMHRGRFRRWALGSMKDPLAREVCEPGRFRRSTSAAGVLLTGRAH
jgi:hypothetical protein